jgi:hypothetical protein
MQDYGKFNGSGSGDYLAVEYDKHYGAWYGMYKMKKAGGRYVIMFATLPTHSTWEQAAEEIQTLFPAMPKVQKETTEDSFTPTKNY